MRNRVPIILLLLLSTSCAFYPRSGNDWLSNRQKAKSYHETAEKYGWTAPGEEPVVTWNQPTVPDPCLVSGWMVHEHYSRWAGVRWLQKRHVLPVRKTEALVFGLVGRCAATALNPAS